MDKMKIAWKRLPHKPRRVLTFVVGSLMIILSLLIGWLPGPGGMIFFLLGVAILATEFTWAEQFRDWVLKVLKNIGHYAKRRPIVSALVLCMAVLAVALGAYVFYTHII